MNTTDKMLSVTIPGCTVVLPAKEALLVAEMLAGAPAIGVVTVYSARRKRYMSYHHHDAPVKVALSRPPATIPFDSEASAGHAANSEQEVVDLVVGENEGA